MWVLYENYLLHVQDGSQGFFDSVIVNSTSGVEGNCVPPVGSLLSILFAFGCFNLSHKLSCRDIFY